MIYKAAEDPDLPACVGHIADRELVLPAHLAAQVEHHQEPLVEPGDVETSKRWPVTCVCWVKSSATSSRVNGPSVAASALMLNGVVVPSHDTARPSACASASPERIILAFSSEGPYPSSVVLEA